MKFNRNLMDVANMFARKKPGRPGRRRINHRNAMSNIAEILENINPTLSKKFASIAKKTTKFKAGSELADNVKSVSITPNKTKFKAGSELADNVKSASPADVKKLADELVNLTVKEVNELSKKEDSKKEDSKPSDADSDDDGLLDNKKAPESFKAKLEEAGADIELK
jgi:thioredoxin reductase